MTLSLPRGTGHKKQVVMLHLLATRFQLVWFSVWALMHQKFLTRKIYFRVLRQVVNSKKRFLPLIQSKPKRLVVRSLGKLLLIGHKTPGDVWILSLRQQRHLLELYLVPGLREFNRDWIVH